MAVAVLVFAFVRAFAIRNAFGCLLGHTCLVRRKGNEGGKRDALDGQHKVNQIGLLRNRMFIYIYIFRFISIFFFSFSFLDEELIL